MPKSNSAPPLIWKKILGWFVILGLLAGVVVGSISVAFSRAPIPETANVFISPHPDDEFQMWSRVENRPKEYKIFVFFTRGEESGFCTTESYQRVLRTDLGEIAPTPAPEGRWSDACIQARISSTLGFISDMSKSDPTVPGDWGKPSQFELPEQSEPLCRMDGDNQVCDDSVRRVDVWLDKENRGAAVFFNLGDGDLTKDKAALALQTMLDSREEWGLAPQLEVGSLVGAFASDKPFMCFSYPHPDHLAVHEVLQLVNFHSGPQLGATCATDFRQRMSAFVSADSTKAAFNIDEDGNRLGAHERRYGWLNNDTYPVSQFRQNTLFQRFQSFWVAFN